MSRMLVAAGAAVFAVAMGSSNAASASGTGVSLDPARVTVPLTSGWRFKQASGLSGVETSRFNDSDWSQVTIPHTWNRLGNEGLERSPLSNNIQGAAWYRLHFTAPAVAKGSRYFLQFDAVGTIADVWVNGQQVLKDSEATGAHAGRVVRGRGWTGWKDGGCRKSAKDWTW